MTCLFSGGLGLRRFLKVTRQKSLGPFSFNFRSSLQFSCYWVSLPFFFFFSTLVLIVKVKEGRKEKLPSPRESSLETAMVIEVSNTTS